MNHDDHLALLRPGIADGATAGPWADLGSGEGAFTLALADLLGPGAEIYSVDRDRRALRQQETALRARFPQTTLHPLVADFTQPLDLPPLAGVVMANSLHFIRHKDSVLDLVRRYLRPTGRLLLVEYNTDRGNVWAPHPLSYPTWEKLARRHRFTTRLLVTRPSRFLGAIYSAVILLDTQTPNRPAHQEEP